MNTRAIHFRLISWYTFLVTVICIGFGAYTYNGLKNHLYDSLSNVLTRRTALLCRGIIPYIKERGETYSINQIKTIFTTEENSRFMRISYDDGKIFYISGMPKNVLFNPAEITPAPLGNFAPFTKKWKINHNVKLIILTSSFAADGVKYTIEVGETTESMNDTLNALLLALYFGLPFVIILTAAGGYLLVKHSLRPVENIRLAAEKMSLYNLKNRLPVVQSGDSIEHLSRTLNKMLAKIDDAYQQASRFTADASHELRTPLTVMRGELESIILEPTLPPDIQDRLGVVFEEATRLSAITEGLLGISRLDAGEARMKAESVDLAELVKLTLEQMRLLADEKKITVICDTNSNILVEADPARLKQVIVNLLDNAIKYTADNGNISLKVIAKSGKALFEIADNGIGIPPSDQAKIFDRFYRADKARSRDLGGAGLGLSIVKSIITAHNGTISVDSIEGNGSKFIVELPLA